MASDKDHTWVGKLVTDRQVVPRWHAPSHAATLGERGVLSVTRDWPDRARFWLDRLKSESENEPSMENVQAVEETTFILTGDIESGGLFEARVKDIGKSRAAKYPSQSQVYSPDRFLGNCSPVASDIARLRVALNYYPNQSNLWSELARKLIISGNDKKADRAMRCALQLSPNSTYIRRAASRMYLHLDEPKRALQVLRSHPAIKYRPHLLAADIAISSSFGLSSPFVKLGVTMSNSSEFLPCQVTELSAAIGTLEMKHGKHKKSRQWFGKALIQPNENVVAQALWANQLDHKIIVPQSAWALPNVYEARTLRARSAQDWDEVLDSSTSWLEDELYSTRPAILGSFACFDKKQSAKSERIATLGLCSTANNHSLLNNRAVCRAYLGNIAEAFKDVEHALATLEGRESAFLLATLGLVSYRTNRPAFGDLCYGGAVDWFIKSNRKLSAILAMLYWLRETSRYDPEGTASDLSVLKLRIKHLVKEEKDPEIFGMIKHVQGLLDGTLPEEKLSNSEVSVEFDFENLLGLFSLPPQPNMRKQAYLQEI